MLYLTRSIGANMWTTLTLVLCAVYPAKAIVLHFPVVREETGPIHIHMKSNAPLKMDSSPLQPDDVAASKMAEDFLKGLLPIFDARIERHFCSIMLLDMNVVISRALYNFVLKGFGHATLDNLAVCLSKSRVDFNGSIPSLSTDGPIFMNGIIEDTNFTVVGNLSTFLDDVKISGVLDIQKMSRPSQLSVLQITDADITIDISDTTIQLNIVEEPVASELASVKFMNKPVDDIIRSLSGTAVRLINDLLAKIPADTIINFLAPWKPMTPFPQVQRRLPSLGAIPKLPI